MGTVKILCLIILMLFVLGNPARTCTYAFQGLSQWATRMVPTLFPFMMLSSLMISSGADKQIGRMLTPVLKPFLRLSNYGIYTVFIGFLCGFPMGAKTTSELYLDHKISKEEAEILLGFSNNIGPAYFLGMILPILRVCGYTQTIPFLFGMYGIPLLYGILISHLSRQTQASNIPKVMKKEILQETAAGIFRKVCMDNIQSVLLLGGYVTFINAFRVILDYWSISEGIRSVASSTLEIIGGVQAVYTAPIPPKVKVFWIMTALSFGGLSCMMQTGCFLEKAQLSMLRYTGHKLVLTFVSAAYYCLLLKMLPH